MLRESNKIIVYNAYFEETVSCVLISAIISEVDRSGKIQYLEKKAIPEVLIGDRIKYQDKPHAELISSSLDLQLESLHSLFKPKGRKKVSLKDIAKDPILGKQLKQLIDRKVGKMIQTIVDNHYPFVWEAKRREYLEKNRIITKYISVKPKLYFKKSDKGIDYTLEFREKNRQWQPFSKKTHVIGNNPGWIIGNFQLYKLQNVNGNKIKPFTKKPTIFIKPELTETYFKKFILDIADKADIETEGFKLQESSDLKKAIIEIKEDLFNERLLLNLKFNYGDMSFDHGDTQTTRKRLHINGGNITIHTIKRNKTQEQKFTDLLLDYKLEETDSCRFITHKTKENPNDILHWLIVNKDQLINSGFIIREPTLKDKSISLDAFSMVLESKVDNDWFDIYGRVMIGGEDISFADFLPFIQKDDPYFPLPDGSYFVIPAEWMAKFSVLARMAMTDDGQIKLQKSQYTIIDDLHLKTKEIANQEYIVQEKDFDYTPSALLKATLRPYQYDGVKWLITHHMNNLGACLADDMGLGKTLQTIALLLYVKEHSDQDVKASKSQAQMSLFETEYLEKLNPLNTLIVLPASLIFNWFNELQTFAPHLHVMQYVGPKRKSQQSSLHTFDIVLTTYQTALRDQEILKSITWNYIILDESQMIKNKNSQVFKAINSFETNNKLSLTGTPVENSLSDLWSQMQFINSEMLGNFAFFKKQYIQAIEKYKDDYAKEELKNLIAPFILRRTKFEVAKDLPELVRHVVYSTMEKAQEKKYEEEKSAARNFLLGADKGDRTYKFQIFKSLLRLRQISNHPKLFIDDYKGDSGKFKDVINTIETLSKAGHKMLIFSSFKKHLELVEHQLKELSISYAVLTGDKNQKQRQTAVQTFQEVPECKVFLISIKAGGTGLNLTAADYVLILDPWWNPFVEEQAIARAHRIGQTMPVTVMKFITKDSIEEKIMRLQERKKALFSELISTENDPTFEFADFEYMLE